MNLSGIKGLKTTNEIFSTRLSRNYVDTWNINEFYNPINFLSLKPHPHQHDLRP